MKKMLLLAAAAAFAMSATAAGPGASSAGTGAKAGVKPAQSPEATLYDQNSDDNGVGIVSQNFESTFDAYDAQGADDFSVPAGQCWKITEVDVTGVYFNGSGPADSVHVTIYKNKGGAPAEGKIVADFPAVTGDFSSGSFALMLPSAVKAKAGGKYWVSVQANMAFGVGGEWGWETRNTQAANPAMWKNPGDGFATGCTAYGNMNTCLGASGEGPDFMFALKGKSKSC